MLVDRESVLKKPFSNRRHDSQQRERLGGREGGEGGKRQKKRKPAEVERERKTNDKSRDDQEQTQRRILIPGRMTARFHDGTGSSAPD